MATDRTDILADVKWPVRLTLLGMGAEAVTRAFWPFWSVIILALALLMLGVQDMVPVEWVWAGAAVFALAILWAGLRGARAWRAPTRRCAKSGARSRSRRSSGS